MKLKSHITTMASITLVVIENKKTKTITIPKTDDRYPVIKRALKKGDTETALEQVNTLGKVEELSGGAIMKNEKGGLRIGTDDMPQELMEKIQLLVSGDFDPTPFVKLWERLSKCPSEHSKKQFFRFIQKCNCNITSEGFVIVYKGVSSDLRSSYKPVHKCKDGSEIDLLHTPGSTIEIPREEAADDPGQACSYGLHCAPWNHVAKYYGGYGNVVELLLDPADVVSIPYDGNGEKMRVCKYKVLRVMTDKDTPLQDILAKMKTKETSAKTKAKKAASEMKETQVDTEMNNLVMPPDTLLAIEVSPRKPIGVYVMDGYLLVGDWLGTEKIRAKLKDTTNRMMQITPSMRNSVLIPPEFLMKLNEDKAIYLRYNVKVHKIATSKVLHITPDVDAGLSVMSSKKVGMARKTVAKKALVKKAAKVEKKEAKKTAPKKTTKKAAKKAAKKTPKA